MEIAFGDKGSMVNTEMRKKMSRNKIRIATAEDTKQLLEIYAPYVTDTAISFEYTVPSPEEFSDRIHHTLQHYPYLVAERGGRITGYAYAGAFKERAAYDWAVETTIYVRQKEKKTGVGRALYEALEQTLQLQHIINLNACIACPEAENDKYLTRNSIAFHAHMGYQMVGTFHRCGYKFNRWYDMVWMEKHLTRHPDTPLPVKPFPAVRKELAEKYGIV